MAPDGAGLIDWACYFDGNPGVKERRERKGASHVPRARFWSDAELLGSRGRVHASGAWPLVYSLFRLRVVPVNGLEPLLPKEPDFESSVSTNSTTPAFYS